MLTLKTKISLLFYLLFTLSLNAQPFLFNVEALDDSVLGFPPQRIDQVNLNSGSIIPFVSVNSDFYNYYLVPSNDWIVLISKFCEGTRIYNIPDTTIYIDVPPEYGCFGGGLVYSGVNDKIYYFEGINNGLQLTSIQVTNEELDSLLTIPLSYNQPLGNREAFLSADEEVLYFNVADTMYDPSVNDKDFVYYFSTTSNQIIQTRRLHEFGYPNTDGYGLFRGRKGKAIVESFNRNQTADSYYRFYDFDNDTGSGFIFYQGYTTPYFTGGGEYLVLPETVDSALYELNTGTFFVYNLTTGNLIKTLTYPPGGGIYTFDNYPSDIYYVLNLETEPVIYNLTQLRLNSISPETSFPYVSEESLPVFTGTATGEFFTDSSVVYFNGEPKTTNYISDSVVTFEIQSDDIAVTGNYPVWVSNYGSNSDTLIFSVVDTLPQTLTPTLQCVEDNGGGSFTAFFGYTNNNSSGVFVPLGNKNKFAPNRIDRGQPRIFLTGTHNSAFSVNFDGDNLTWTLNGVNKTASKKSPACP